MRILLTNHALANRAGSELYVVDLATRLLERGHSPIAYSPHLGGVAESLRAATVPVVHDLDAVAEPPDLIHGQHHLEAMTAMLHFPGVPALFVCHGWLPWEEIPPRFPRIRRYVAVDLTTRDRLVCEYGIPPAQVEVILNFVDLARFRPRPPLPEAPRRALVFSNSACEDTYLPAVREACARSGVDVDVAGLASGRPAERPEALLPAYDLVFAKGRAALEAMAVGAAVVLCDRIGSGPMVRTENLDRLRSLNFGVRALQQAVEPGYLQSQIEGYDAADASEVSRRIRSSAGLEQTVDRYLALYQRILAEPPPPAATAARAESEAAATYLRWLNPYVKERARLAEERDAFKAQAETHRDKVASLRQEAESLSREAASHRQETTSLHEHGERLSRQTTALQSERERLREQAEHLTGEVAALRGELAGLRQTATWRLREKLLFLTPLVKAYRFLRRSDARERLARDQGTVSERHQGIVLERPSSSRAESPKRGARRA